MTQLQVPFFRPSLEEAEVNEVVETLRSGWLTSGPKVNRFEKEFAAAVGSRSKGQGAKGEVHAIAVNSGTAALHLAVEALGLRPGEGVLVPTMTFAATAEVVRYQGAIPILVDCDPVTLNMDLDDAQKKIESAGEEKSKGQRGKSKGQRGKSRGQRGKSKGQRGESSAMNIAGIMPVHVGGVMMDLDRLRKFANKHKLWTVEDAAHAFPAGWRTKGETEWQHRTNGSRSVTCYSFYANKTITTGEGGMAVTSNARLAQRMKLMSLHGLSHDAWGRYSSNGNWDYKIVAPGYKYNLTDIAAAIGIHQLSRAEAMRLERESIAQHFSQEFAGIEQIDLPNDDRNRLQSWHLYPIRLKLKQLKINRHEFMKELKANGVGCSVHWRPLHLHPYYQKTMGWKAADFPVATAVWKRLISLPIFPGMRESEIDHVIQTVKRLCARHAR